jgi:predicted Zn-dependent peptidase
MEKRYITKNGVSIYSYKNPGLHGFFISLFLRAGSMYEKAGEWGITHFLEHISIRNVNKQMGGSLYRQLDRQGVEFNASTYAEMVQFYVSGAADKFDFAASLITRIFSPVCLTASEVEAERKRIKAEIRESDDKGSLLSFSNTQVHGQTSLARQITGTLSDVNRISARGLEEYRRRVFSPDNFFFYVTGSFTDEDISRLAEYTEAYSFDASGEIHNNIAPVSEKHFNRGGDVAVKNADFTAVRFTFDLDMSRLSVPVTDLIYDILLSGYDSEFFMEMSERRGLFYDISGAVERYRNMGELYFSYEVRQKDLYEAVKLTVEILNRFKSHTLPDTELMKSGYVDNASLLYDDAREFNFTMAYDNHIMNLAYPSISDRAAAYKNVSAEEVRQGACEIFRPENLTLTLKGNKKKIDVERLKNIISEL